MISINLKRDFLTSTVFIVNLPNSMFLYFCVLMHTFACDACRFNNSLVQHLKQIVTYLLLKQSSQLAQFSLNKYKKLPFYRKSITSATAHLMIMLVSFHLFLSRQLLRQFMLSSSMLPLHAVLILKQMVNPVAEQGEKNEN